MAIVYKSILMEIDDLTVQIMHLAEKLIQYKLEVEKTMNNGFYNIAKARYIMGSKCVSTLQLPTENSNPIQPLATLCRAPYQGYWVFKANRRKPTPVPSEEKIKQKGPDETIVPDVIKDILEKDSKTMRKRKEFYLVDDNNYKELNDELQDEVSTDSSESKESLVTFTDPIRLFGVLVPQTLRIAQKSFQDTVDLIAACATIQSQILTVLERYRHLKKVNDMIVSAAEERDFDLTEEKKYWSPSEESLETSKAYSDQVISDKTESKVKEDKKETESELIQDLELGIEGEGGQFFIPEESVEYLQTSDEYDETTDYSNATSHKYFNVLKR